MTGKAKDRAGWHQAAPNTADSRNPTLAASLANVARAVWVASYRAEEARQRFADREQSFLQAGACVVLALLRLASGRHA